MGFRVAKYARAVKRVVRQYPSSPMRYLQNKYQEERQGKLSISQHIARIKTQENDRSRCNESFSVSPSRLCFLSSHCLLYVANIVF